MRSLGPLLLSLALFGTGAADPTVAAGPEDLPRITAIEVETGDVFTPAEERKGAFPYRLANRIHATTRRHFVERMLLFRVGDPLDPKVFEETERNLRATDLFQVVDVEVVGTTVRVTTRDRWTLFPKLGIGQEGGVTTYVIGAEERNLLGTGRTLAAEYRQGTERTAFSVRFEDRQLLRQPYLRLNVLGAKLSDGEAWLLEIGRPFFAMSTRWSATSSFSLFERDEKLWAGGIESAVWKKTSQSARVEGGRLLSGSAATAARLKVFAEYQDDALEPGPLGEPPPAGSDRRFLFVGPAFEWAAVNAIVVRQVDRIDMEEDFNLATKFSVEIGGSPGTGALMAAGRLKAAGATGARNRTGFGIATFSAETRYEDGPRAGRYALDARWWFVSPRFTLATRVGGTVLHRPDPEVQLHADSTSGLRGYRLHSVSGTSQVVANVELRKLLRSDVLSLLSLGVAVFVDGGLSWGPPDGSWTLLDAGAGLRLGVPRSGKGTVFRVDIAYTFLEDPQGRRGFLWSFGAGQVF